ncbi:hypothetical protein ACGVWS_03090 [Enterobacteriaceae bacterium LUAb1]
MNNHRFRSREGSLYANSTPALPPGTASFTPPSPGPGLPVNLNRDMPEEILAAYRLRGGGSVRITMPEETLKKQRSWLERQAYNALAIISRNAASVCIPTAIREIMRNLVFAQVPAGMGAVTLGFVAGYSPCVTQFIGLYRDHLNHTDTRLTIAGRILCIALAGGSTTTLIAIGAMTPSAAAALAAANFVYTPLRDFVQYYIQRKDNLSVDARCEQLSSVIGAVAYIPNQFLVNEGMQYLADTLEKYTGSVMSKVLARPAINFLGECMDDTVSLGSKAYLSGTNLEAHTRYSTPAERTSQKAKDQVLNVNASRSAFSAAVFNSAFGVDHFTQTSIPNKHSNLAVESAVVGMAAGAAYLPFVLANGQTPPRQPPQDLYSLEEGRHSGNYPTTSYPGGNSMFWIESGF